MAQVLDRQYDCLTCHKPIRISKIDNAGPNTKKKWEKFELDGVTPHVYNSSSSKPKEKERVFVVNGISKEIAAIKAQLLVLVSKLDRMEQEMIEH